MSTHDGVESPSIQRTSVEPSATGTRSGSAPEGRVPLGWGAGLLLLSGLCGLVFQVSWFREFRLVFGASTAASSAVLAIFMGGLGVGNIVLGARVDRAKNPLRLYAMLEICVALTAFLSPFLIDALHACYIFLGGQLTLGFTVATAVRLMISGIVLGVPTFLMGGTLPAAVRAVTVDGDRQRRGAALLYGANTFGAVIGAFGSTFFILQYLGTRNTLWAACLLNAITGVTAFAMSRRAVRQPDPNPAVRHPPHGSDSHVLAQQLRISPLVVYVVAGITGFCFFLMELVWYRMLGPVLGGTTFTFGLILTVALIGIGLGAAAYSRIYSGNRHVSLQALALNCALEACCILMPFMLGDEIAILAARLQALQVWHFAGEVTGWFLVAAIVILPTAIISGIQFPMIIALLGQGDQGIGKQVGQTFGWNTTGAICGSLAGGFGLLPLLSAPEVWRAVALLLVLQSVCLIGWSIKNFRLSVMSCATLVATMLAVTLSFAEGPTAVWRHGGIGAGRGLSMTDLQTVNSQHAWENAVRRSIVWEAEGVESSVAIRVKDSLSFYVNGKSDGNAIQDAPTQIMLGVIGAALHPEPKRAFVVGLGTGETAGWLADIPSMQQVDVVELEPVIREVAHRCRAVNGDVLTNPKVRTIINDAREVLLTTKDRYDLIVCEPSNPYRSGVANLFTQEFYRAGKKQLNDGGVFVQWIQAYETDEQTMQTVFATFQSVFSRVEVWESQQDDLVLVGFDRDPDYDLSKLRSRLTTEPFKSALLNAWQTDRAEGFFAHYVGGQALVERFIKTGISVINTDDRNEIEYAFARTVGNKSASPAATLHRLSSTLGDQRHPAADAEINWQVVRLERQWFAPSDLRLSNDRPQNLVLEHYLARNLPAMLSEWETRQEDATCLNELAAVALAYAQLGNDRAEPLAARLQPDRPIEADLIRGILAVKQRRIDESCDYLAKAFVKLRQNPWTSVAIREAGLDAAIEAAAAKPEHTDVLLNALAEPFQLLVSDESRRDTACLIAGLRRPEVSARLIETYEPHVPWSKRFLAFRKQVYEQTHHHLQRQADLDLQTFLQNATSTRSAPGNRPGQ